MSIENEYIRIEEVAKRLGLSPKSVRNKMSNGTFKRGVHFFKPIGITPRFSWSAIEKWMREEPTAGDTKNDDGAIAISRGYKLDR